MQTKNVEFSVLTFAENMHAPKSVQLSQGQHAPMLPRRSCDFFYNDERVHHILFSGSAYVDSVVSSIFILKTFLTDRATRPMKLSIFSNSLPAIAPAS